MSFQDIVGESGAVQFAMIIIRSIIKKDEWI